ncbi:MAG TPA: ATP-binding protein [Candidatus Limnocylindrales bacterium]|nr:ATP-binding protein [Candidatus Limnocylindrales bacterium]
MDEPKASSERAGDAAAGRANLRPVAWPPSAFAQAAELADRDRLQQELVQAQKMEAIGQLVSGVAHELNNPLAAIVAFSELIRRDPRLPDDLRHDADLLVQEADRTRRIVQSLLDFARQRPPERHPTVLRALIKSVLDLQAYSINASRIDVELDVEPGVPPVPLDRAQMQQVLLNVTLNAIQAIHTAADRGTLAIRVGTGQSADGTRVARISITDDGPGVPDEHRDRLFVPFFSTKEPGEGTGLGLPVSFGIVAAHGGHLRHEPGPDGRGATFVIELPLSGGDPNGVAEAAAARETPRTKQSGGRAGRPPRVLVLDDEPSIRRFLAKALQNAGFEAVLAGDGREALTLLGNGQIDAMMCDHRMAGMSGTQVFEAAVAIRPELADRFVFMSGDVLNPELRDFAESRGIGLLAKPFDLDSVGRTLRGLVDRVEDQSRG